MTWLKLKRVTIAGIMSLWRNNWVTLATILVMTLAVLTTGSLLLGNVLLTSSLSGIENKVDVSVYFKTDAEEPAILGVRDALLRLAEVKSADYISRDDVLNSFKERHIANALITQSLDELDGNPFGATLNIKAKEISQYEGIARFLEAGTFSSVIDKINYRQNKLVIERLSNILSASRRLGAGLSIALAVIAVLVTFNTIRLAIYTSKEEISVMRLVGASNRYVRGPFIVAGIIQGILAAIIAMLIFYPLTLWLGPRAESFFGGPNLFNYYLAHFLQFFAILLGVGILLGSVSSFIAIRRYLKI